MPETAHSFQGDSSDLKRLMLSLAHVLGSVLYNNKMSRVGQMQLPILAHLLST